MPERSTYAGEAGVAGCSIGAGERFFRIVATLVFVFLFACVFTAVLPRLQELSRRRLVAIAGVIAFVCAVALFKNLKEMLIVIWVGSMTFFRPYSSFDGWFGLEGLYWVPSHAVLAALYALWAFELVVLKRPLVRYSPAVWPLFIPFLLAALLSAAQAQNTGWAITELVRVSSVIPIFIYCRYNLGRSEWQACVAGLGIAILAQVTFGTLQVTTRKMLPEVLEGPARAQGTMEHPNILADYLLLLFPAALALALAPVRLLLRAPALVISGAAGVGVVITLSRVPWVLIVGQVAFAGAALVLLRMLRLKQFLAICAIGAAGAMLGAVPFLEKLEQRIKGDLKDSIQFRSELNTVAGLVFDNNPFVGVGLNNLSEQIFQTARKYGYHNLMLADTDWTSEDGEGSTMLRRVTVHNLYMYLLAETGLIGICALLVYVFSGVFAGIRAVRLSTGAVRAVSVGLVIGIIGALLHNFAEIALWLDPMLHTFALVVSMLFAIPALAARHGADWLSDIALPRWMRGRRYFDRVLAGEVSRLSHG